MSGVIIRIALRYIAAALVAKGAVSADVGNMLAADADVIAAVEIVSGAAIGVAVEAWYFFARRFGWST